MVTASIVVYKNRHEDIFRVIESARCSAIDKVWIIDHACDDELEQLCAADDFLEYVRHENLGYGSGHNVALHKAEEAGARYHSVLNPDVYWEGDIITPLTDYMEAHPDVGQMMPKVYYPSGKLQLDAKLCPSPLDLIANRFLPKALVRKRIERFCLAKSGYDKIMNVPYLHGCFMFFRMSALKEVGWFDERFFMYPEDIDITRRIHAKYKTLFYPHVSIVHAHEAASHKNLKMLWIHIYNMVKYFNKWGWVADPERKEFNRRLLQELGL